MKPSEKLIETMELGSVASVSSVRERGRCSVQLQGTVPLTQVQPEVTYFVVIFQSWLYDWL